MIFSKKIEFSSTEEYVDLKQDYPKPAKYFTPEWFKKLNHSIKEMTVKGCMPFLDTLTTGYILSVPQDYIIRHNVMNEEAKKLDAFQSSSLMYYNYPPMGINLSQKVEVHSTNQLAGSPLIEKNKNLPFHKIMNPWLIKTPPGYSCLFVPPLNNKDDRFEILPGIVDTDTYEKEVNFPIVINGDKYPSLDTIIKKGTPYVQVIPFKRNDWEMKIKVRDEKKYKPWQFFYRLKLIHAYKTFFWKKKNYK